MTESKNPGQVSAYLDEWTLKQIQAYAKSQDRSVSWVVGFAVKQFFVAHQDKRSAVGQVHLEDAIAAAVKRGPVPKVAKHK
jgi:predicted transcriptional regulator